MAFWMPNTNKAFDAFAQQIIPEEQKVFDKLDRKEQNRTNPTAKTPKITQWRPSDKFERPTKKSRNGNDDNVTKNALDGGLEQNLLDYIDEDETTGVRKIRGQRGGDSFEAFKPELRNIFESDLADVVNKKSANKDIQRHSRHADLENRSDTAPIETQPPSQEVMEADTTATMRYVAPAWRELIASENNYNVLEINYFAPLTAGRSSVNTRALLAGLSDTPLTNVAQFLETIGLDFGKASFYFEPNGELSGTPGAWCRSATISRAAASPLRPVSKAVKIISNANERDQPKSSLIVALDFSLDTAARFFVRLVYGACVGTEYGTTPNEQMTQVLRRLELSDYNRYAELARETFFQYKFTNNASNDQSDVNASTKSERYADTPTAINNVFFVFHGYYYYTSAQSFNVAQRNFTMAQDEFVIFTGVSQ